MPARLRTGAATPHPPTLTRQPAFPDGGGVQWASPFCSCTHPWPRGLGARPGKASFHLCCGPFAHGQVGEVTELWELAGGRAGLSLARRPFCVGFPMGCGLGALAPDGVFVGRRLQGCAYPGAPTGLPSGVDDGGELSVRLLGAGQANQAPSHLLQVLWD